MIEISIAGRIREVRLRAECRCFIGVVLYCEVSHETKKVSFFLLLFFSLAIFLEILRNLIKADYFTSD